jgi:hypothetical protein
MKQQINLEIKKTFNVGGVEYNSKDEAMKALAMEILTSTVEKGIEEVIQNSGEVIKALRIIKR